MHRSGRPRAIEIDDADHAVAADQRHDQLGARRRIASDMPWKRVDVLDQHRTATCHRGTADPCADGDAYAGRSPLERPEHEFAIAHQVEARPVQVWHHLVQEGRGVGSIRDRIRFAMQQGLELLGQLAVEFSLVVGLDVARLEHDHAS